MDDSKKYFEEMTKIVTSNEEKYLEYLLNCCKNMVENKDMVRSFGCTPPMLQLYKMRNEIEERLLYLQKK